MTRLGRNIHEDAIANQPCNPSSPPAKDAQAHRLSHPLFLNLVFAAAFACQHQTQPQAETQPALECLCRGLPIRTPTTLVSPVPCNPIHCPKNAIAAKQTQFPPPPARPKPLRIMGLTKMPPPRYDEKQTPIKPNFRLPRPAQASHNSQPALINSQFL